MLGAGVRNVVIDVTGAAPTAPEFLEVLTNAKAVLQVRAGCLLVEDPPSRPAEPDVRLTEVFSAYRQAVGSPPALATP